MPGGGVLSGRRLLEHVTPLVLPRGAVAEALGAIGGDGPTFPASNRLADRALAWALYPAPPRTPTSAALQLAVAAAGHRITLLPPGRLCNTSVAARSASGSGWTLDGSAAAAAAAAVTQPGGPLDGSSAVAAALKEWSTIAVRAKLDVPTATRLRRWLRLASAAYELALAPPRARSATNASVEAAALVRPSGDAVSSPTATPSPSRSSVAMPHASAAALRSLAYAPHCYGDHPNVRDLVLVLNFNNYDSHPTNATLNVGPLALRHLRRLYAPYFPLIVATTDFSFVNESAPAENVIGCAADSGRKHGWGGGIIAEGCAGSAVDRHPGRLGYALVQDDTFWMPWTTLALDPHKVWNVGHGHNRSNWW